MCLDGDLAHARSTDMAVETGDLTVDGPNLVRIADADNTGWPLFFASVADPPPAEER